MREVRVSHSVEASPEDVRAALSPEAIVDYEETYRVTSVRRTKSGTKVSVEQGILEMTLEFRETETGYEYEQHGEDGPFEELSTSIRVTGDDGAEITVRSRFTFGSMWAVVLDRLAERRRRKELVRLVANLVAAVEDGESEDGGENEDGEENEDGGG